MRMDNYTKKEMTQDFKDIKEHIQEESLKVQPSQY